MSALNSTFIKKRLAHFTVKAGIGFYNTHFRRGPYYDIRSDSSVVNGQEKVLTVTLRKELKLATNVTLTQR